MNSHRQSIASNSKSIRKSRDESDVSSGWLLNPEVSPMDTIFEYKVQDSEVKAEDENQKESLLQESESESKSISSQRRMSEISSINVTNKSPMRVSEGTFYYDTLDCFALKPVGSQEEQYPILHKKYKNDSLPEVMTEPELRMHQRYLNKIKKDYAQKVEANLLLDHLYAAMKAKGKVRQQSLERFQRKKVIPVKEMDYRNSFEPKVMTPKRCGSLPSLKPRVIDTKGRIPTLKTQQTQTSTTHESSLTTTLQKLSTNLSLRSLTLPQSHSKSKLILPLPPSKLQTDFNAVQLIQNQLRRKGIKFEIMCLRKGLTTSIDSSTLKSFPSKSLISNPIIRKWGL